ncbi:hypothetical protein BRADI_4g24529v3 [Brachypodium distachyon]|uniref:non-specific serine/threonine protein kinase n=1 Tax=Brachypodium distachyon TaxID=15368 RepID=A0A2K2CPY6_BRADI|nr:hypothetical protein BRADI_4g24529v3 [Brachypodium distachyon]
MTFTPGKTLTSDQDSFALGFFSPSNSTKDTYVGIWFNDIPLRTIVWLANRDNPITDASSAMLGMTNNSSILFNSSTKLLNTGNLVVLSSDGTTLWQSFENPSDSVLAGMPIRTSHNTHPPWQIISWKGPQDPSRGIFSAGNDPDSPLQFFVWNGSVPYWRAAAWNGYISSNMDLQSVSPLMYLTVYKGADGEFYSTFELSDGSSKVWYKVDYLGRTMLLRWNTSLTGWTPLARSPAYQCNLYGFCGVYGYCDNKEVIPTSYAYANLSTNNIDGDATRCLMWTGDIIDVEKGGVGNEILYLRLAGLSKESHELPFISFQEIVTATNNFSMSNLLGQGGFGKVYKGNIHGDKVVAVKRLSRGSGQGMIEFRNELVVIAKLQHRNLKILIYEYVSNKSLDAFIFNSEKKLLLDWPTRFKIIKGVARGLLYLHQDSRLMIIHRDLKTSNILLDGDMNPKISDFGMARIFGGDEHQANTTNRVVGTYGYMSPEYAMEGLFSVKSDVYSFGVLLLETEVKTMSSVLCTYINYMTFKQLTCFVQAWNLWREGVAGDLVDPSVVENCSNEEALCCIHVGLCVSRMIQMLDRFMSNVVSVLES